MDPTVHPERSEAESRDARDERADPAWLRRADGSVRAIWALLAFVLLAAVGFFVERFVAFLLFRSPARELHIGELRGVALMVVRVSWVTAATWLSCKSMGWRLPDANLRDARWHVRSCLGAGLGLLAISSVVLVPWAAGQQSISMFQGAGGDVATGIAWTALSCAAIAVSEELMLRGFALRQLERGLGATPALVVSAVVFGLLHTVNPNVTWVALANIVLVGLWFGLTVQRTGSVWFAVGIHFAWNFAQGSLWGAPISGHITSASVFASTTAGDPLWTGGTFGPEGSLPTTAVLLGMLGATGFWTRGAGVSAPAAAPRSRP